MFSGFSTRSEANQAVQPNTNFMARSFKFRIEEIKGFLFLSSENKGPGKLCVVCIFVFT